MKSPLIKLLHKLRQIAISYPYATLLLVCIGSRLPHFLNEQLFLDPDECVSATMAEYLMKGKDFSLFFWGQQYGLSIFENLAILPFYFLIGISTLSVKLGLFSLWTGGVLLLYNCLYRIAEGKKERALLLTVLFVLTPSWAVWCMKARGGYLTAFVGSMLTIRFLFSGKTHPIHWLIIGLLLQLVYQSHALWLIGLIPLAGYQLWKADEKKGALLLPTAALIPGLLLLPYKAALVNTYKPQIGIPELRHLLWLMSRFPNRLLNTFHGTFYFGNIYTPGRSSILAAALPTAALLFITVTSIRLILRKENGNGLFISSTLFIWGFYLFNFVMWQLDSRYLLSVPIFTLISLTIYCRRFASLNYLAAPGILFAIAGLISIIGFKQFEFQKGRKKDLLASISYLQHHNIRYCFCDEAMLPWHLRFYSKGSITARMRYRPERYPTFANAVDSAFYSGAPYALVGVTEDTNNPQPQNEVQFGGIRVAINANRNYIEEKFSPVRKN